MWTIEKLKELLTQLREFLMPENEIAVIMKAAKDEMKQQQKEA